MREVFEYDKQIVDANKAFAENPEEAIKTYTRCGMLRTEIARLRKLKPRWRWVKDQTKPVNFRGAVSRMRNL